MPHKRFRLKLLAILFWGVVIECVFAAFNQKVLGIPYPLPIAVEVAVAIAAGSAVVILLKVPE